MVLGIMEVKKSDIWGYQLETHENLLFNNSSPKF